MSAKPKLRCAVYTRKSHEEGLEQEYNSLDAQYDAAANYIQSQKHEGWVLAETRYDDGGYSGGTLERPALQRLLDDIQASRVDVVVVYKIDRLSRSLIDFLQLVEIFDKHAVTFVSITQHFNTTSSMGRLMLHILLSFAQFEREVTSERIRDKFAAAKRKGLWMGGVPPLGYDVVARKLVINPQEADIIRFIFKRCLKHGSCCQLAKELAERGDRSKSWLTQDGNRRQGRKISTYLLRKILSNPVYFGKISHKGEWYDGEHEAIVTEETWKAAQAKMQAHSPKRAHEPRTDIPFLLRGILFDQYGWTMTPHYSGKKKRGSYRYYVSAKARKHPDPESDLPSISAQVIEEIVTDHFKQFLSAPEIIYRTHIKAQGQKPHITLDHVRTIYKRFGGSWESQAISAQTRILKQTVKRVQINPQGIQITFHPNGFMEIYDEISK